ncbi:MAG: RDD family protein [Chitinophagales bacterium]
MFCSKCGMHNQEDALYCISCGSSLAPAPAPVWDGSPEVIQLNDVTYAGFWKRFAAALIDGIILAIAGGIVGGIIGGSMGVSGSSEESISSVASFAGLVLNWLYYTLMESSTAQATLGKMALGIKVTDLYGNRITFGRANGRYWSKIISTIILLIGYIMAGFTEKKQALHDLIAKTLVVNKAQ